MLDFFFGIDDSVSCCFEVFLLISFIAIIYMVVDIAAKWKKRGDK
jgi:hypothetical protein